MKHIVDAEQYLDAVCDIINSGEASVGIPVKGTSMLPFLNDGDTVMLSKADPPFTKGDILLFRRKNGPYVLHRVVSADKNGGYVLLGDAQRRNMAETVMPDRVAAKAVRAVRNGKTVSPDSVSWKFYAGVWCRIILLRQILLRIASAVNKLKLFRRLS